MKPFFISAALVLVMFTAGGPASTEPAVETRNEGYLPEPPEVYDRIPVSDSAFIRHRGLPSRVDLAQFFPPPGKQGKQGSCVGWATTYALKSYHEKRKRNHDFGPHVQEAGGRGENVFSPAWTYNQVNKGKDRGAHIPHALDLLVERGAVTWAEWPYNVADFKKQPTSAQLKTAAQYRAKGYETVPAHDTEALKAELANGQPMVIGVNSGPDRWKCCRNESVYDGYTVANKNGHAMVLIGYDDNKRSPKGHRGAFKIMDSDGNNWGTNGYGWVSYEFAQQFFYAAYALRDWQPQGDAPIGEKLSPPKNLRASQGTESDSITVTWAASTGALGYQVLRSDSADGSFGQISETAETHFKDYSIDSGRNYYYRIVALNETEKTSADESLVASGYAAEQKILGAVQGLKGELLPNGQIRLSWQGVELATSYKVTKENFASGAFTTIATPRGTTHTDIRPAAGPNTYAVIAIGRSDEAPPSASITVEGKSGMPGRVEGLQASAGVFADKIQLTWTAVPGADRYWVVRFNASSGLWQEAGYVKTNAFSDSSPEAKSGTVQAYSVRAISGIQAGPAALPARGHANTNVNRTGKPPLAPANLKATATKTGVLLQFAKVADAADYLVFRKAPGESNWNFIAATKTPRFSHELDVSGKLFFYAVRARGTNGVESELSKPIGFSLATDKSLFKTRSAHALLPTGALNGSYAGNFYGANGKQVDFTLEIRAAGVGSEILFMHSGRTFKTQVAGITEPHRILASGFEIAAAKGNFNRLFISCRQKPACGQPFRDTATRVR
ncbi:C1 family peptidase [Turneriella parva]|uniref:Fibronectin type III domain protein n=1 Tax=Turneriella parva (strain ATCC BAA-1111 / DSM 21527 / NCTC 11395 / H) TaxID=869212 RepID=I4B704_TURPD|nr:C1 family peptidase [Turneriella parva]AFM13061.1 Fibronectin type III domain protein [Turneriella parva DSM 21527]